eukprot:COSAG05_NODE_2246_length_3345_cov_5.452671_1_plen_113_part_00
MDGYCRSVGERENVRHRLIEGAVELLLRDALRYGRALDFDLASLEAAAAASAAAGTIYLCAPPRPDATPPVSLPLSLSLSLSLSLIKDTLSAQCMEPELCLATCWVLLYGEW